MVYEERLVVLRRSANFQIFPITDSRLSTNLVLNCINFCVSKFLDINFFFEKIRIAEKSLLNQFCAVLCSFEPSTATYFFWRIFCILIFRSISNYLIWRKKRQKMPSIPAPTKLNSGESFGKSTLKNFRIPILRQIGHDSIIFYKVRNSKENLGFLGVQGRGW